MSLTVEGVFIQASVRAHEVTHNVPATRSTAYRRVGIRQQELFAMADKVNHEYNGTSAVAGVIAGAVDLATITDPVPVPEELTRIEVANGGTSIYPAGTTVHPVPVADYAAAIPPRVTIRNRLIKQVGLDLFGVVALRVYYVFRPPVYCPADDCEVVALRSPYDELLVLDLAQWLLRKSPQIDTNTRTLAMNELGAEEASVLSQYLAHVRAYAPFESRFDGPPAGDAAKAPAVMAPSAPGGG